MPEDDGSERMRRFQFMRIAAWSEGRWRACRHGKCRAARKCKGGSRGTFTRHGYPDCYTMQEAEQLGG